ncbi:MAG: hypothetical protein ACQESJ_00985 [Bacteroidota bacterium]
MFYKLFLLINFLGVFLINALFPGGADIRIDAPEEIVAGEEVTVRIEISESELNSFARLQQELPGGITAEVIEADNAEFKFENQKVKFIWLNVPEGETINLSYKLIANDRLKGSFQLQGSFDYIQDNERKTVDLASKEIKIQPSPDIDSEMLVDVSEFKSMEKTPKEEDSSTEVKCIRQSLYEADDEGYIVNLLVHKGNKKKFAKIQETVPEGYTAVKEETKDAIFTFKDQTAKFLWMNLPSEPHFVVSYRVVPKEGTEGKPELNGEFSYIENENTRKVDIVEKDIDLTNTDTEHLAEIIKSSKVQEVGGETGLQVESKELAEESEERDIDYSKNRGEVKIEIADEAQQILQSNAELTNKLEPQSGVYYRVQIAAGHRPIDVESYFDKYNIEKEVRIELHEGWRKYSVGSFDIYKEARDYRVHIWNNTSIDDAFVAAYNSGDRITVQEALMITNHKWYK